MNIAICDDNRLELQMIKDSVHDFFLHQPTEPIAIHSFTKGEELLHNIQTFGAFDLLILDIMMPRINGIELAAKIRCLKDNCKIIFLTSSPEYALASYKVNAYYYLIKGSHINELHTLLQKALNEIQQADHTNILIKEKGKWTKVQIQRIQYVECINHTVYFHLHKDETISSFSTMNEFHDTLLSDKRFIKCHKSYIVNMQYVTSLTNKDFLLEEDRMPISRNLYSMVKETYFDHIFKLNETS